MLKTRAFLPLILGSTALLFACGQADETAGTGDTASLSCSGDAQEITLSDQRTLCVALATEASSPFTEGFYAARVAHLITLSDIEGTPIDITVDPVVTGLSHHPMMHMNNGHNHTTPHSHDPDSSRSGQGIYTLIAYYNMATASGSGMHMGDWHYHLYVADSGASEPHEVTFEPVVESVAGGDILVASGSNAGDSWTNPDDLTVPRQYRIWLEELAADGTGVYDLALFVSTQDLADGTGNHGGATFPAVYTNRTLYGPVPGGGGARPDHTLSSVLVELSIDDGASWQTFDEHDHGIYHLQGLTGLTAGTRTTFTVRLTVNGLVMQASGSDPQLRFAIPE